MNDFYKEKGIKREYSVARTPKQNRFAERRNKTLIGAVRTMLTDSKLPITFWAKVINTACYVQNGVLVVKPHFKTPYEMFRGRTPALSFMRPIRCHVTILNTLDHLRKFNRKLDEWFLFGYSTNSKAFRVYNTRTRKIEENLHIKFLENKPLNAGDGPKCIFDIDTLTESMNYVPVIASTTSNDFAGKGASFDVDINTVRPSINTASSNFNTASPTVNIVRLSDDFFGADNDMRSLDGVELDISNISTPYPVPTTPNTTIKKDHSLDNVIEPKRITYVLKDPAWVEAMQEELLQFHLQKVWTLVDLTRGKKAIGTKSVFRNKKDEKGIVIRNKTRFVDQGCTQEEGIDYNKVFVRIERIEAIRLFLAYACFMGFFVYQMDVKSAFLYGRIKEEVYVCQPLGFEDPNYPDNVYKVKKALYGLHQALRAWYETLASIFLTIDFAEELCTEFEVPMHDKFQMSLVGELTFFLGSQVKQKSDGIFISQDKYVDEILRKFKYEDFKLAGTPTDKEKALLKDSNGDDVDVHLYSDYAGASLDRKSTLGGCQFLGCKLISWQCKKQTMVATSTTKAEYVAATSCCGQVLWI
nr:hypothetical protein [Tanacetum cinerariifolium]